MLAHSGWAKKLERRISWCFPPEMGFSVSTGARKSLGTLVSDHAKAATGSGSPWDQLGSLVDELVEGMLSVGSALSPDDGLKEGNQ